MSIAIIAAMGLNRAIGRHNRLPWAIPEDLAHFKALTMGHPIIMGRKTYESLPQGALPGRRNIVVSRSLSSLPDAEVYRSLEQAIRACSEEPAITHPQDTQNQDGLPTAFIIGGASVYRQALPLVSTLIITLVEDCPADADAFFPAIDTQQWVETKKEKHQGFSFITYRSRR